MLKMSYELGPCSLCLITAQSCLPSHCPQYKDEKTEASSREPDRSQIRAAEDLPRSPCSRARPLGHLPATRGLLQPSAAPQAVSGKRTPSTQRILAPPHPGKRQRATFGSPGPPGARPDSAVPQRGSPACFPHTHPAAKHDSALLLSERGTPPSAAVRPPRLHTQPSAPGSGRPARLAVLRCLVPARLRSLSASFPAEQALDTGRRLVIAQGPHRFPGSRTAPCAPVPRDEVPRALPPGAH